MIIYEENKQDLSNIFVNPIYYGTETGANWCNCICFWCCTPGCGTIWGDGRFCFVTGCGQQNGICHCGTSPNKVMYTRHTQYCGAANSNIGCLNILCPIFKETNGFYANFNAIFTGSCRRTYRYYLTDGSCIYYLYCLDTIYGDDQNFCEKIFFQYQPQFNCLEIYRNNTGSFSCSTLNLSGWSFKNIVLNFYAQHCCCSGLSIMCICHYNYLNIKNAITFEQFCKLGMLK